MQWWGLLVTVLIAVAAQRIPKNERLALDANLGSFTVTGSGLAIVIGSLSPWVAGTRYVQSGDYLEPFSVSGMDSYGAVTLPLGVAIAAVGLLMIRRLRAAGRTERADLDVRFGGHSLELRWLTIAAGITVVAVAAIKMLDIWGSLTTLPSTSFLGNGFPVQLRLVDAGLGLVFVLGGGAIAAYHSFSVRPFDPPDQGPPKRTWTGLRYPFKRHSPLDGDEPAVPSARTEHP